MGSALHLILLQLSIALIIGAEYLVNQPKSLEAVEGDSITIPCSFTYTETYKPMVINICWRRNEFHGEFIFNKTNSYTHPDYRGRLEFLGDPFMEKTCSIRIKLLKQSDSRKYFGRVVIWGLGGSAIWQNIPGTALSVRERKSQPTTGPLTSSVTATSTEAADGNSHRLGQGIILIIRSVLALGMLAIVWLIGIYLLKRNGGSPDRRLREESKQETRVLE